MHPERMSRRSGVLLHPTSLPGPSGIGELGAAAEAWVDFMIKAGLGTWQILPLGPTGYGDSPYQSFSTYAGNPLLISLDALQLEGCLPPALAETRERPGEGDVHFGHLIPMKLGYLKQIAIYFLEQGPEGMLAAYEEFCQRHAAWLDDYAEFMAIKDLHQGAPWVEWNPYLRAREGKALAIFRKEFCAEIDIFKVWQYFFFHQWERVHALTRAAGIEIIGDIPFFVAHDSADVWAHPELYYLDEAGNSTVVAGVPPDIFSPTGQRWGNPLYRWDVLKADGYRWWINRILHTLGMVDVVRLDHFRGFESYWEVLAYSPTAEDGTWVPGPGADFFTALEETVGRLPIIAEDLGMITPPVLALRDQFDLPGMKVLFFAFTGDPDHDYLPHNYSSRFVVYTGTHDNNTARGWYEGADENVRDFCRRYLATDGKDIAWDFIRAAWSSVAERAVAPLQDFLGLGSASRMNFPGRAEGNWSWRVLPEQLSEDLAERIRAMSHMYSRLRS